jgi:hypothetical protein
MHITIRSRKMTSGSVDELMRKLDQGFMPIVSQAPGYVAYYCIDSGDGVVSAISIFDDESTAEASNRLAESWVRENLGPVVPGPAEVISGTVMVPS